MKTFVELETDNARTSVTMRGDSEAHGLLMIDGRQSSAVLTTSEFLSQGDAENGWFDLSLRTSHGRDIVLHNALRTSIRGVHDEGKRGWEVHIYPNSVVFDADARIREGKIKTVAFKLDGLKAFFHYQTIEWQPLFDPSKGALAGLKALRDERPKEYDFFDPNSVYVVHNPKRAVRFKANGRTYSVSVGISTRGLGWSEVALEAEPIAELIFDEPVNLDAAIAAVWSWKRFFSILGMNPLPVTAMAIGGSTRRARARSPVYIPSHNDWPTSKDGMFSLHPASIPLNRWKDRKALGRLMETWAKREPERALFRAAMGNVIDDCATRLSTTDVLSLCAGIETLAELDKASSLSKKDVRTIAAAAKKAVQENALPVEEGRIDSVLAQLRRQSLVQRLRQMFGALGAVLPAEDAKLLEGAVVQIRNASAHGQGYSDAMMPSVEPAVSGLLSVCALYDLATCGMPLKTGMHARRLEWAIAGLRQVSKKPAGTSA